MQICIVCIKIYSIQKVFANWETESLEFATDGILHLFYDYLN